MSKPINTTDARTQAIPETQVLDKLPAKDDTHPGEPPVKREAHFKEAFNFHVHEHTTLRKELELRNQELLKLQVYALVGTFAVWSWLAASSKPLSRLVWYIPVIISLLGYMKAQSHLGAISRIAEYLRGLEDAIPKLSPLQGWENFIHEKRDKKWSKFSWNLFFWLILIAATITVPFLFLDLS